MKTWRKPEVIALSRGTAQEAVLATCKGGEHLTNKSNNRENCRCTQLCHYCKDVNAS